MITTAVCLPTAEPGHFARSCPGQTGHLPRTLLRMGYRKLPSDASSAAGQSTDCIDRDVESNKAGVHCGQSALRDNRAWHPRSRSEPERLVPRKDRREAPSWSDMPSNMTEMV